MKRKLLIFPLCLILSMSFLAGCNMKKKAPHPIATHNPDISIPEGRFLGETPDGQFRAEGGLVSLGEDSMRAIIEGKEYEFVLSEKVKWELSIFNKDSENPQIMRGTMLGITYSKRDLIWTAETIDIITAN